MAERSFELHLKKPKDLFVFDAEAYDPMDPTSLPDSGLEYILQRMRGWHWRVPRVRATLYLPLEECRPELETAIRTALQRHCTLKIEENHQHRLQFLADSIVFLAIAIVVVVAALFIQINLDKIPIPGGSGVHNGVSVGLDVVMWVALWTPASAFVLDWFPYFHQGNIYRSLRRMPISIKPEPQAEQAAHRDVSSIHRISS